MSAVRRAEMRPCHFAGCAGHRDCAVLYTYGRSTVHLSHKSMLALADDLAAILDTDGYVPRHARVAS